MFTISNPTQYAPLRLKCVSQSLKLLLGLYTGYCTSKPLLLQTQGKRIRFFISLFFFKSIVSLSFNTWHRGCVLWFYFLPNKCHNMMVHTFVDTVARPEGMFKSPLNCLIHWNDGLLFCTSKPLFLPKLFIAAILTVSKAVISRRWWTFTFCIRFFFFARKGILNLELLMF